MPDGVDGFVAEIDTLEPGAGIPPDVLVPARADERYRAARIDLLRRERALRDHAEEVAAARRALPPGPVLDDYRFEEETRDGRRWPRLGELFGEHRTLVVYHLMFPKGASEACPMCSMWVDGLQGVHRHLAQHTALAVVAGAEPGDLRAWGRRRGWHDLRLLSCGETTFNSDLGAETEAGAPRPAFSVLLKEGEDVRFFYTVHASFPPDGAERGIDLLSPVWQVLDLLPQGRGGWYAGNDYVAG
ncbi:DUF899 domain-containing protein [Amycolatopsis rhizosphaerae]|uniref:DUF899 domain-containing protein n=1 Tax=Amycolatopsis rhizosphaerae TaxID=2053003 RepID=A0A558DHH8_9PSEU|nr:DUF899 family protein [Amycolatopsis rhizosphaerae]TVT60494.1 DUF899 domain-containing protein [Amycolatopsis rhizosphaerae]